MNWHDATTTDDLPEGGKVIVEVNGKSIGVFHEAGKHYAVLNFCPHSGAPVCEGQVTGRVTCDDDGRAGYDHAARTLRCPWHRWEFDLTTGRAVIPGVRQRLKTYPTRIIDGKVQVQL